VTETNRSRVRIGLIGAGRIGKIHAENIARHIPDAELVAVADVDLAAAEETADRHAVREAMTDHKTLLDNPDVDAVAICSATDTHARLIEEAAAAGKHIFCEKPIALDLAVIDRALEAVDQAGVKLQVGFNRRFDTNFRKVREAVEAGKIGLPHLLRITSRDPSPPPIDYVRVSGGIFLDMTIHDFDMARFLLGDEVEEIFVAGAVLVDPAIGREGDIDTAIITLKFANGALGAIDNSRYAVYGYDQRVELFGSEGMIAVANDTADTHVYSDRQGVHSALPLPFYLERYKNAYRAEMEAFVASVLHDEAPPVSGRDARIPVVMGLAAKKSYQENRPVRLSEIG
jgi:myo-inositol 2-dehydrogenase/D-chiro-inositol 1-dehydrogenase